VKIAPETCRAPELGMLLGRWKDQRSGEGVPGGGEGRPEIRPGGLQPVRGHVEGPDGRGAQMVPESGRPAPGGAPVRLHVCVLPGQEGRHRQGDPVLRKIVDRNQPFPPPTSCSARSTRSRESREAKKVYKKAADNAGLPEPDRRNSATGSRQWGNRDNRKKPT